MSSSSPQSPAAGAAEQAAAGAAANGSAGAAPEASTAEAAQQAAWRLEEGQMERDHVAAEVQVLREQLAKRGESTADMVTFMKRDLDATANANRELTERVAELEAEAKRRAEKEDERVRAAIEAAEQDATTSLKRLRHENDELRAEIAQLGLVQAGRDTITSELEATRAELAAQEERHQLELNQLERKFIDARDRMLAESNARMAQVKSALRQQVVAEIDQDSRRVRTENGRMARELQFHSDTSDTLAVQNEQMRQQIKKMGVELELASEKDMEYARRGVKQSRLIKDLTERVRKLERALSDALHDMEIERASWREKHDRELHEAQREADVARGKFRAQSKELRRVQKSAKAVLRERTELESFFHECLAQVKREAQEKREMEYRAARAAYSRSLRGGSGPAPPAQLEPIQPGRKSGKGGDAGAAGGRRVDVADLEPAERERVLRLLFARINGSEAAQRRRMETGHAFVEEGQPRRGETFVTDLGYDQ